MISFSSGLNEQSGQGNVVLAVPCVSACHGCDVGSCKFGHFDNVCSRVVCDLHVQHFPFAGVTEFGVLRLFDVDEHHEDVGEEHFRFAFDSDLSSWVFSQTVHETFDCVVVVLLVACVVLGSHCHIVNLHAFDSE